MEIFPVDEAAARMCFMKMVYLVISKNSQENTFAGVLFY